MAVTGPDICRKIGISERVLISRYKCRYSKRHRAIYRCTQETRTYGDNCLSNYTQIFTSIGLVEVGHPTVIVRDFAVVRRRRLKNASYTEVDTAKNLSKPIGCECWHSYGFVDVALLSLQGFEAHVGVRPSPSYCGENQTLEQPSLVPNWLGKARSQKMFATLSCGLALVRRGACQTPSQRQRLVSRKCSATYCRNPE